MTGTQLHDAKSPLTGVSYTRLPLCIRLTIMHSDAFVVSIYVVVPSFNPRAAGAISISISYCVEK